MSRFEGQIAWVTGAGSGIGRAAAERLAEEGARVVLIGRRADALAETAAGLRGTPSTLPLDLSSPAAVAAAFPAALEEHGVPDVVVHAAGQTIVGALHDLTDDQWDRTGRRSNGSVFTVRTLAAYFLHDVEHHLHDVGA